MGIKGNLSSINLADILQLIGLGAKTGCLVITTKNDTGYIFLKNGIVIYGYSENKKISVEKINQEKKIIEDVKLKSILGTAKEKGVDPFKMLLDGKFVNLIVLKKATHSYILSIIYDFFKLQEGDFEFLENKLPKNPILNIEESYSNIIMEGSRRIDEIGLIEKVIKSDKTNFIINASGIDKIETLELKAKEKDVLKHLNKITNIYELSKKAEYDEFDLYKIIYGCYQSKIIEILQKESYETILEHIDLAQFYLERENYDGALKEAERAFSLAPIDEKIINLLMLCTKFTPIDEDKKRYFVIPLKFAKYTSYSEKTLKFIKENQPHIKEEKKTEEKKLSPRDALVMASKFIKEGKNQEVVNILKEVGEIRNTTYYLLLGNACYKLKDLKGSYNAFSKFLELNPENEKIKKLLSIIKTKI